MLYDRKWDRPSLAGFRLWLDSQPPQMYDYADMYSCVLARYYRSIGVKPKRFADELFATYEEQYQTLVEWGVICGS